MEEKDLKVLRHSAAHLAAQAVIELFPDTKLTIGPATEEGFFYDVLPTKNFKEEDLKTIEERMREISKRNLPITHTEISKEDAYKMFKNNQFKTELIDNLPGGTVGLSVQGDFKDLCRGGHVKATGDIKYFKLLGLSGSYWRADRSGQPLQRISGTAFFTEKDLKDYEQRVEDAEKYDHRRLGKQLDLFSMQDEGPGFPFYHPKGKAVINALIDYMRFQQKQIGYKEISTPIMLIDDLWKTSGHMGHYKENMYFCGVDDRTFAIKPMNCPGSILVYKSRPRSFRELPLKLSEFGLVHRHELSGALHGLLRVREFTQDDVHVYCTAEQIEDGVILILKTIKKVMHKFGFDEMVFALSTRPEKYMGSDEIWQKATKALKNALEKDKITYKLQEGEGAFYGPKIDVSIKDSMGREWQCGTIQVDFAQPENFDLTYISSGGEKKRPVILHSTMYGSLERFFAVLLEHHKGLLPFFIAPVQMRIIPITESEMDYAQEIYHKLLENNFRVELDTSSDPLSGKIKTAQLDRIPWMIIIGKQEKETKKVTLRYFDGKQLKDISVLDLINKANAEIDYKK